MTSEGNATVGAASQPPSPSGAPVEAAPRPRRGVSPLTLGLVVAALFVSLAVAWSAQEKSDKDRPVSVAVTTRGVPGYSILGPNDFEVIVRKYRSAPEDLVVPKGRVLTLRHLSPGRTLRATDAIPYDDLHLPDDPVVVAVIPEPSALASSVVPGQHLQLRVTETRVAGRRPARSVSAVVLSERQKDGSVAVAVSHENADLLAGVSSRDRITLEQPILP